MPVALVTGVGRRAGIAAAVATALADDGWDLILSHWSAYDEDAPWGGDPGGPTELAAELRRRVRVVTVEVDLSEPTAPGRLVETGIAQLGALDALVVAHARSLRGGLMEATADEIDLHVAVNARATLLLIAAYARHVAAGRPGRVVALSSNLPLVGEIAYAASKGALEWVVRTAALELAPRHITVNAVDPGPTDTGWMDAAQREHVMARSPMGRIGLPRDVAGLAVFLCSDRAAWLTGQVIRCDGGYGLLGA